MVADSLDSMVEILETERVAAQEAIGKKLKIILLSGLAISAILAPFMIFGGGGFGFIFICPILTVLLTFFVWLTDRGKLQDKFVASFKSIVVPALLSNIDDSLRYDLTGSIGRKEFVDSGLFQKPDKYEGKDRVFGKVGHTDIRFSLVCAKEKHKIETTDSKGRKKTETVYLDFFKGLIVSADFNKRITGNTLVRSKKSFFSEKHYSASGVTLEDVKLEDPRFNSFFIVKSSDQIEARYVLTPSMMERIVELKSKFESVDLSFTGSRVILALPMAYDVFEPNIKLPFTDRSQLEEKFSSLKLFCGLVDELDLNTRIWMKK